MLASLAAIVAVLVGDVDVVATKADDSIVEGRAALGRVEVVTDYGRAIVEEAHIGSIDFADRDTLLTDGGVQIAGNTGIDSISIVQTGGEVTISRSDLKSLVVIRRAELKAGEITDGTARNRVTYHLRAPEGYAAGAAKPAILILHGSNMSSRAYVNTIAAAWPEIAKDYILIGINGEQRNSEVGEDGPTFNYTYVNYVGKSTYKGYPGTDRESPALVAEVVRELKAAHPIGRVFVGGHSQGGFLTYSLMMNEPDLFSGAFPISAGLIFQCEPGAYENAELIALQKNVPLAIVHATNDPVVGYGMGRYAWECFEDAGFPMLRLFNPDQGGHMFANLPVDRAIRWLEAMTTDDPAALADAAETWAQATPPRWRDVAAAVTRLQAMHPDADTTQKADELRQSLDGAAATAAETLRAAMKDKTDGSWVEDYAVFHADFAFTQAAAGLVKEYQDLRTQQQPIADELFQQARQAHQSGNQDEGRKLAERIVKECYASDKYRVVKGWLDN